MSIDPYRDAADGACDSARAPFAIAPHDSNELTIIPKAIYVGTGGSVTLRGVAGSADVVFKNVASGQVIDVRARFVRATGTTAADLVALA
ncbi:spike base protein, RCAP_Rcc01079 family [Sphingomonas sp.]|uniref:spike base protein, RCAP_Rcc01079 family n=1 Tax=Sphingomonas sp. TaxID=28214 RepID=UPI003CC6AAA1